MGQNSSHYLLSVSAFITAHQTALLPLLWNLTKTLNQLGASHHFHPRDPSEWLPLPTTLSLTDLGPCRTQHFFPYFDELEQWLGEANRVVNVSCQWPCVSSLWQSSPQRMPYGPWPNLGQPRGDTTHLWGGASPALTLRHYSPPDLHSLRFMLTALRAQMTEGKGCPLQFCKTTSFSWVGQGQEPDRPPREATATYFLALWMQWHMDVARDAGKYSSHLSIPCHPICSHIQSKCTIFVSQMLPPCASYWERYACRSSAVSKTQGKDIEN